jgi:hypothetical protein
MDPVAASTIFQTLVSGSGVGISCSAVIALQCQKVSGCHLHHEGDACTNIDDSS